MSQDQNSSAGLAGMTQGLPMQQSGLGNNVAYPSQGGQPQMGQPNPYSNTTSSWDNASIMPQQNGGGKAGKGGGQYGGYPVARTNFNYALPQQTPAPQSLPKNTVDDYSSSGY
jgi:hypothetical protein